MAEIRPLLSSQGISKYRQTEDHIPDELSEFTCQASSEFQTSQKAPKVTERCYLRAA
jgi:hypothetical protein